MSVKEPPDTLFVIDPDNLDRDCFRLPRAVRYWGRELTRARRKTAEAKNQLKLVVAEVRSAIRAEPARFGIEKITVDSVDDALAMDTRYQDAQQALVLAEEEEGLLEAGVKGLKECGDRLSDAVWLYGLMYFAAPRVDQATRERYEQYQRQASSEAAARKASQDSNATPPKPNRRK